VEFSCFFLLFTRVIYTDFNLRLQVIKFPLAMSHSSKLLLKIKRSWVFVGLAIASIVFIHLFSFWREADEQDQVFIDSFKKQYGIYALPMPDTLTFAGEPVPIYSSDIMERYDRELLVNTYWQSQTMLFFKRAHRWFPVIEPILEKHGVPNDFKYLALIESGLMNVVSPAGATGFWQILEGTGRELGLEVNAHIDERYHVEKATEAACKYLLNARERFGSWTLAAAAYNIGNARLSRVMDTQRIGEYYNLHLNDETARYMFRILAVKTIFSDPAGSGFHFRLSDLYEPYQYTPLVVDTTVTDLVAFAQQHNTTYKDLRILNPWLRGYELPNRSRKRYEIKIPVSAPDAEDLEPGSDEGGEPGSDEGGEPGSDDDSGEGYEEGSDLDSAPEREPAK
jgi:membrane-bound lytic murein transglycosylase D